MTTTVLRAVLIAAVFMLLGMPALATVTIDFEDLYGYNLFMETVALREEYASLGIHFMGPGERDGGAVLDAIGGGWFFGAAHSGENHLGFNPWATLSDGGNPVPPETLTFDIPALDFYCWVAAYSGDWVRLEGYDEDDNLVDSELYSSSSASWHRMDLASSSGIHHIIVTASHNSFGVDDIGFTPAPEPVTLVLLGSAVGLGAIVRKRARR